MNLGGIMVSPLELERIIDGHPSRSTKARPWRCSPREKVRKDWSSSSSLRVGAAPVLAPPTHALTSDSDLDYDLDPDALKSDLQAMISSGLNPLFRIYRVVVVDGLPHTASGKLVRRELRSVERMHWRSD